MGLSGETWLAHCSQRSRSGPGPMLSSMRRRTVRRAPYCGSSMARSVLLAECCSEPANPARSARNAIAESRGDGRSCPLLTGSCRPRSRHSLRELDLP